MTQAFKLNFYFLFENETKELNHDFLSNLTIKEEENRKWKNNVYEI